MQLIMETLEEEMCVVRIKDITRYFDHKNCRDFEITDLIPDKTMVLI